MMKSIFIFCLILFSVTICAQESKTVNLNELDLSKADQIKYPVGINKNVFRKPIVIDSKEYEHGIGLHTNSMIYIDLKKNVKRFYGVVGYEQYQDYHPAAGKVILYLIGDDKILWKSKEMGFWSSGENFDVNLEGVETLQIWVLGVKSIFRGAVNIGNGTFEYKNVAPATFTPEKTKPYILTPPAPKTPKINGPFILGVRPESPILVTIAATGENPMSFSATNLPEGVKIDSHTGIITGSTKKGIYSIDLTVKNSYGTDEAELLLKVGDQIALTPPMGWSSWNAWGSRIDQDKVMGTLHSFEKYNLGQYGWTYINIDDGWQGERGGRYNAILPNDKFPDIKEMIDSIHTAGYKFGIYSSPWKTSYAGRTGSSADTKEGKTALKGTDFGIYPFHEEDVKQWAEWGVDYMKYDWWPNDPTHTIAMSEALKTSGRDIIFSISNAAPFEQADYWVKYTNLWRTTGDIYDSWPNILAIGCSQEKWQKYAGPGHWNDPDMMVFGWTGIGERSHLTKLSADEQYSHISFWAILSAPLILGCDMTKLDDFTLNLITNSEVIAINQDANGQQAKCLKRYDLKEVWVKELSDGSKAVGLFNRGLKSATIEFNLNEIFQESKANIRDVWRQKNLGTFSEVYSCDVPGHGVILLKVSP